MTDFTFRTFDELTPEQETNRQALAYWAERRGQEKLPPWSAFDPLDITEMLPQVMIVHCESKEITRILLFGTRLVEAMGIDLTGANFYDIYDEEERAVSMARTWAVRSRPAAGLAFFIGRSANGGPVKAEVLTLPFAEDDGSVDHLIMSVAVISFKESQPNVEMTIRSESFDDYRFYDL